MSVVAIPTYRKVSLDEAREVSKKNPDAAIIWRPDDSLPEENQYALIYNE